MAVTTKTETKTMPENSDDDGAEKREFHKASVADTPDEDPRGDGNGDGDE